MDAPAVGRQPQTTNPQTQSSTLPGHDRWNPVRTLLLRLAFRTTIGLAASLALFVLTAPLLADSSTDDLWRRVCLLFARDELLRKTAVVAAIGLWATALVFFRGQGSGVSSQSY
jgi:hypothetical protein